MPECLVHGLREQTDNYSVDSAVRRRSTPGWSPAVCLGDVSGWGCHSLGEPVFRGWMNGSGAGREDWAGDRDLVAHLCAGGNRGFEGGALPGVCEEKRAQDSPGEGGL